MTDDGDTHVVVKPVELQSAATERDARNQPVVNVRRMQKTGAIGALLRPIGFAIGLCIVGYFAISAWNIYSASEARRALHEQAVHAAASVFSVSQSEPNKRRPGEVELVVRKENGHLIRVLTGKDAASNFLNTSLRYVQERERATERRLQEDIARVFDRAFADRHEAVGKYADWFFEWGRSWQVLWESIKGGVSEGIKVGLSQTKITDAARHEVEAYLLRGYKEHVLKAEQRNPVIVEGLRTAMSDAHREYRSTLAGLADRLQLFIREHGRFVEPIAADKVVSIKLDWDTQKWKTPRYAAESNAMKAIGSLAVIAGSTVILGPVLEATVVPIIAGVIARIMGTVEYVIGWSVAGSAWLPGAGTLLGGAAGVGIDWVVNKVSGDLQRPTFVEENLAAIEATMSEWKGRATPPLDRAMKDWFADTEALIVGYKKEMS